MSRLLALLLITAAPAHADVPNVVADIAPVHALVALVMEGVGSPDLIIPSNASPHGYAMRPSEARDLSQADVVIWVGPTLTPWLQDPIDTLGSAATHLVLAEADGINVLPFRTGDAFEGHDHDHDHDHSDADTDAGEATQSADPHLWLDPENASIWLTVIADALAIADPENADTYHDNADRGQVLIARQEKAIATRLEPLAGTPFVVLHDAYHYFESHFGIEAIAAVSAGDAAKPGAARIASLRAHLAGSGVRCAFAEPQINTGLLDTVTEGLDVKVGILDPLGADLAPGPGQYVALLGAMADSMVACLTE